MTNFEKIKQMTVAEMAAAIVNGVSSDPCDYCEENPYCCNGGRCHNLEDDKCVKHWLESEADEE